MADGATAAIRDADSCSSASAEPSPRPLNRRPREKMVSPCPGSPIHLSATLTGKGLLTLHGPFVPSDSQRLKNSSCYRRCGRGRAETMVVPRATEGGGDRMIGAVGSSRPGWRGGPGFSSHAALHCRRCGSECTAIRTRYTYSNGEARTQSIGRVACMRGAKCVCLRAYSVHRGASHGQAFHRRSAHGHPHPTRLARPGIGAGRSMR